MVIKFSHLDKIKKISLPERKMNSQIVPSFRPKTKMEHQDWEPVIIRRPLRSKKEQLLHAQRNRQPLDTFKKYSAGKNKQSTPSLSTRKLESVDTSEDPLQLPQISKETAHRILSERTKKGWSRKDLAMKLNVSESVVTQYENGTAIPNPRLLQKMSTLLGIPLKK